ncbi:MAG: hypothetical protein AMS21_01880 [Gemmatimonas sp. SG8_38_2]|nr:MAG: hypothetical protein AMS21_01880 [Gemmatimonas sp. SG8_38_2]
MSEKYEIQFEDLHGVPDGKAVEVDLEAESKGIREVAPDDGAADDARKPSDDADASKGAKGKADEGEEDSGDDKFSKKFRDRLSREQRAKKKAQDEAREIREQNARLEARLKKLESSHSERELNEIERNIGDIEKQLEDAIEKGETKTQLSLTRKMTDLQAELKVAKKAAELMGEDDDSGSTRSGKPSGKPDENPYADDWMGNHSDWYGMKGFERQTRLVNRLDKEVFKDGYDPQTEEYFEELDRRLKEKAPELFDDEDLTPSGKRNRERPPVAPTGSGEDRTSGKTTGLGSKVTLDDNDFRVMRTFGLDTNDPETLKEFARNKREAELQEANR